MYKSGVLKPYEVERRIKLTNGYNSETYSLPMVVALAFRINTSNAVMVRKALLERLCLRKERQMLCDFYSPEFNRKFRDGNAAFSFEEDKNRKGHYQIYVNDIPLVQWFWEKANEWRNGFGITRTK